MHNRDAATRLFLRPLKLAGPVAAGALLILTGCSSHRSAAPRATLTPSAVVASPSTAGLASPSEADVILAQYREFWRNLNVASRLPEGERRRLLARYTADPALRSLLAGIAHERAKGHIFYGAERPRPKLTAGPVASRPVAVIDDCQNASATGLQDERTGKRLTVGTARNHVVATMHRLPDGIWRVVFVTYPKTPC